jgi:hypothetical protein
VQAPSGARSRTSPPQRAAGRRRSHRGHRPDHAFGQIVMPPSGPRPALPSRTRSCRDCERSIEPRNRGPQPGRGPQVRDVDLTSPTTRQIPAASRTTKPAQAACWPPPCRLTARPTARRRQGLRTRRRAARAGGRRRRASQASSRAVAGC